MSCPFPKNVRRIRKINHRSNRPGVGRNTNISGNFRTGTPIRRGGRGRGMGIGGGRGLGFGRGIRRIRRG